VILLAALVAVMAVILGGRPLGAWLRRARATWRPAAGLSAIAALTAALVLLVREDWLPALVLAAVAAGLAVGARRRPRPPAPAHYSGPAMDVQQARAILGVGSEAGPEEVQSAYLRLMRLAHPDRGGTRGLAAQLNAARDRLIRRA
jgi:hypothetical protein